MLPTKSNTADKGCSPVSSNCVIWQGPDLSCINLCNGDSVSDVVYAMATKLCSVQSAYDLTSLDLTCLVSFCTSTGAAPTIKSLSAVLDFIIKKVCCLNTTVAAIVPGGTAYTEPTLTLPACLQYTNSQGQTVTQLIHNQFTLTLATKICAINTIVTSHTSTLASHETRIATLESAPAITLPTVTPKCVLPATPTAMNVVLGALESQFCDLKAVLGSNTQLTAAAAQQCTGLNAATALSQSGTMSGITNWNSTATTVAQSLQNLWITVCDMRAAVYSLKTTAGTTDCSAFLLGFVAAANNDRSIVTLYFNTGATVIPSGFANCNAQGSKVTITDTSGHSYVGYVDLVASVTNSSGYAFTVTGASLNAGQNYTVVVEGCVTKNGNACSKTATQTVSVPCPVISSVTATLT